jgi:hypothetical protein
MLMRWCCMICTSSTDSMSCHTCWWDDAVWFVLTQQILCHVINFDEMMLYDLYWLNRFYVMSYMLMRWCCMICTNSTDSMLCHTRWWDDAVWFVLAQQMLCHVIHVDEMMLCMICTSSTDSMSCHTRWWDDAVWFVLAQQILCHVIHVDEMMLYDLY